MKAGDNFNIESNSAQDLAISVMGMDQAFKQHIGQYQNYEVVNVASNGDVEFKVTYSRVKMSSDNPQAPMEFDSDNMGDGEVPMQAKGLASLVGQSFNVVMSNKGEVHEISGMDQILENMLKQYEDGPPEVMAQMEASLKGQFGDNAVKSQMQQMTGFYDSKKKTQSG